ncbi:hypothetical protein PILCRDRAFT_811670 [Piloderma croceum F 1598]|uniref:Uncharacterized protein n=1 Tax=Piloderma croceum (strain F 1598) TaxID=765440 RepID=A0A0C3G4L2_PILCF|nr:hypothetical protein PILCRDRAFT_811670 [Piloderma croceum F 1598]
MNANTTEHKHHMRKDGSGDLRNKIVELLSTTANGCLSELGYFPGMQDQFQQLIQTNMHLQNDNTKLFEDNRALARVVAIQNDRLAFSAGEDNIKLKQFSEMKESIESLSKEQTRLTRANEMLKVTSLDQGNGRLYSEWQMLQARNDALERDNARVRDDFTRLYNLAAANGILGKAPPAPYTQRSDISRVSSNRDQSRVSDSQAQLASANPMRHHHQRRASDIPPQMAGAHAPVRNHSLHQVIPVQPQPQRRVSEGSQNGQAIGPASHTTQVQYSGVLSPVANGPSIPSVPIPPPRPFRNKNRTPSTPLAIDAHRLPITPISPNFAQNPCQIVQGMSPSTPRAPEGLDVIDLTADEVIPTQAPVATDASSQIIKIEENNPRSPASSIEEPLALSHSQPASRDEPLAMNSPVSSVEEPLIKRSISDMTGVNQNVSENEPRKRSRLDDSGHGDSIAVQVESHADSAGAETAPNHQVASEEPSLRSAEDCIADVFAEDEEREGEQVCNLCVLRYERGAIENPPPPFVRATLDELVTHCIEDHPMVWEKLRRSTESE